MFDEEISIYRRNAKRLPSFLKVFLSRRPQLYAERFSFFIGFREIEKSEPKNLESEISDEQESYKNPPENGGIITDLIEEGAKVNPAMNEDSL